MNVDQQTLLLIRGAIASMTEDQQREVAAAAAKIREIANAQSDLGLMAFALVGAELQMEA